MEASAPGVSQAPEIDEVRARWAGPMRLFVALALGREAAAEVSLQRERGQRSRLFGTVDQSRRPAVADIIGARLTCTVAMISSVSIPWR
jgi:hypothetical protein